MNPIVIVIVILLFLNNSGDSLPNQLNLKLPNKVPHMPPYFDTFRMELLLDKLRILISSLEKINNVSQLSNDSESKSVTVDKIHQSLDAIKDLLADQKAGQQLNSISNAMNGIKQFGDIEGMISTLGPILGMLSNKDDDKE